MKTPERSLRTTRRHFLKRSVLTGGALTSALPAVLTRLAHGAVRSERRIPVVLATDIGDDIDDTWALGFLLKCPELDLKLVVTDYGKPRYRAKLLAKFLQTTGRSGVPIGVGPENEPRGEGDQAPWVKGYDLGSYPGKVHMDGIQALIDTILHSKEPITLISIGPMPNVAAALAKEPRIAKHARFVGMDGSVRVGYGGDPKPCPEWNVKAAPKAAQEVFSGAWEMTITPLDTCGLVTLSGERYSRLRNSRDPVVTTIIENYRIWSKGHPNPKEAEQGSSVLFDTVAVYLAFTSELCTMERLGIRVSDDGLTLIDDRAKKMEVATGWRSLEGYRDLLVNRLLA